MHFVWGRYCNYRATRAIGTNLVAPIQQINLIFTLFLAIWLLGEQLTPLRILGIALVLLGPSVTLRARRHDGRRARGLGREDHGDRRRDAGAFGPNYAEGYLLRCCRRPATA